MTSQAVGVPVHLDALVVAPDALGAGGFKRWTPDFGYLAQHRDPEDTGSYGFESREKDCGVYLHWRLPEKLCTGRQDTTGGSTVFPKIPNRWLVVRYRGTKSEGKATAGCAWILESDYLGQDGTSEFVEPGSAPPKPTGLGRKTKLTSAGSWHDPNPEKLFLDILGPGLPLFSAFQPYNEDVLSFHDAPGDAEDAFQTAWQDDEEMILSYGVVGWYSNPAYDPMRTQRAATVLRDLRWHVPSSLPDAGCDGSLYYGATYGMPAAGLPHSDKHPRKPDSTSVTLALGSNVNDALDALHQGSGGEATGTVTRTRSHRALMALLTDRIEYLNTPDEGVETAMARHNAGFGTARTSPQWSVAAEHPAPAHTPAAPTDSDLIALNRLQDRLRQEENRLAQHRQRLVDLWRLHAISSGASESHHTQSLRAALDKALTDTRSQRDKTRQARTACTDRNKKLGSLAHAAKASLTSSPAAPYHHPQDPTLLIKGAGVDQPLVQPGPLTCRLSHDVLTTLPGLPDTALFSPPFPYSDVLPPALRTLAAATLREFGVIDQSHRHTTAHGRTLFETIRTDPQQAAPARALPEPWAPPWAPLLLEWRAHCAPIPYRDGLWDFDGTHYSWNGTGSDGKQDHQWQVSDVGNRVPMVPLPGFVLRKKAAQAAANRPGDTSCYAGFGRQAAQADMLSQTLAGLNDWYLQRAPMAHYLPSPAADQDELSRQVALLLTDDTPDSRRTPTLPQPGCASPDNTVFAPVRAGQFGLAEVTLIDRFGQAAPLLTDHSVVHTSMPPTNTVASLQSERAMVSELPPRLLHPARVRIDAVDPDDDTKVHPDGSGTPPALAGWIVPNHLDRSLVLYGSDGIPRTEYRHGLQAAAQLSLPTPTDNHSADNATLVHITTYLGQLDNNDLRTLLDLVDTGLTTTGRHDQDTAALALLAGRPLALIRLRLGIEIDGPPPGPTGWDTILPDPLSDLLDNSWPLRLGETDYTKDGLIGYFLSHDYTTLRTPHHLTDPTKAVRCLPHGDRDLTAPSTCAPLATGTYVTVIFDPWLSVHAVTDLLPTITFRLPDALVRNSLDALSIPFSTDPLLTPPDPDATTILMPRPSAFTGSWHWAQRTTDGRHWTSRPHLTDPAAHAAFPGAPATARAGFLQLFEAFARYRTKS